MSASFQFHTLSSFALSTLLLASSSSGAIGSFSQSAKAQETVYGQTIEFTRTNSNLSRSAGSEPPMGTSSTQPPAATQPAAAPVSEAPSPSSAPAIPDATVVAQPAPQPLGGSIAPVGGATQPIPATPPTTASSQPYGTTAPPSAPVSSPSAGVGVATQAPAASPYEYQRSAPSSQEQTPTLGQPATTLPTANGSQLPAGTKLALTVYRPITYQPYEAVQTNLTVAEPVLDAAGRVAIPAGSTVWGKFEPVTVREPQMLGKFERMKEKVVGSQFVAERITINTATYPLVGRSQTIPVGGDPNADKKSVALRGAGYGAAGTVALGVVTGGAALIPMAAIGGFGGAMAGMTNVDRVIALQPETQVQVVLGESLVMR